MLEKGALELVDYPGSGYYSHLFMVRKAERGGVASCDQLIKSEWLPYSHQVQDGNSLFSFVLESIRKGNCEDAHFQIPIHLDSQP